MIVFVSQDLMLGSRVRQYALNYDVPLKLVPGNPDPSSWPANVRLVMLDLQTPGLEIAVAVPAIKAALPQAKIVAYAAHVLEATLEAASAAGCDEVLTRGRFDREIEALVATASRAA